LKRIGEEAAVAYFEVVQYLLSQCLPGETEETHKTHTQDSQSSGLEQWIALSDIYDVLSAEV
jgi:hypothetical protein